MQFIYSFASYPHALLRSPNLLLSAYFILKILLSLVFSPKNQINIFWTRRFFSFSIHTSPFMLIDPDSFNPSLDHIVRFTLKFFKDLIFGWVFFRDCLWVWTSVLRRTTDHTSLRFSKWAWNFLFVEEEIFEEKGSVLKFFKFESGFEHFWFLRKF